MVGCIPYLHLIYVNIHVYLKINDLPTLFYFGMSSETKVWPYVIYEAYVLIYDTTCMINSSLFLYYNLDVKLLLLWLVVTTL